LETCCGYRYDPQALFPNRPDFHGPSPFPKPTFQQALSVSPPIASQSVSRRVFPVKQIRLLCSGPGPVSLASSSSVAIFAPVGSGFFTGFPFGHGRFRYPLSITVNLSLRIDSPMSNHCSHGTLLHFSLQCSLLNLCYSHQDLHQGLFQPASLPVFKTTPAPSYSQAPFSLVLRPGIGRTLQRHPFSGLVHSAGES